VFSIFNRAVTKKYSVCHAKTADAMALPDLSMRGSGRWSTQIALPVQYFSGRAGKMYCAFCRFRCYPETGEVRAPRRLPHRGFLDDASFEMAPSKLKGAGFRV
jgi:hypothetical protein